MPPEDIKVRLDELQNRVNEIYTSVEKTRKYFQWTLIVTVALVVLPALGLVFAIPSFLSSYGAMLDGIEETDVSLNGFNDLKNLRELQDLQKELGL